MVKIVEVKTRKQIKQFIDFPLNLYKGNKNFVPPFYMDEKALFTKKNPYIKTSEYAFFLALDENDKVVGRIGAILQKASNELRGDKRVRFTRFDSIDNQEVAHALFETVENWAKEKQMNLVCGPLGFSDLEREGLLIEGFDELSTFEEQYNYPYYQRLIENEGYGKEVDWEERKLYKPDNYDKRNEEVALKILKRYGLHVPQVKNINEFIKRYQHKLFALLDESYEDLYMTVPFTQEMKDSIITSFKLAVDVKHTTVIVDDDDNVVCFGITFPSMSKAIQKSNGHLTPAAICRLLHAIKHPKVFDLGLIGVKKEYAKKGVAGYLITQIMKMLYEENLEHIETNLNLEYNHHIINCWKIFKCVQHKKRRSFMKKLDA